MTETLEKIAENTEPIFKRYGIKYAGVFGSYARGEARPDSDIDILVTLGDGTFTLLDFADLKEEVGNKLKKRVDIVSDRAVIPYFKEYIYRDLKPIYGEQR